MDQKRKEELKRLDARLQGTIEYYFTMLYNANKEEIHANIRKTTFDVDPDMLERMVDDLAEAMVTGVSIKVHNLLQTLVVAYSEGLTQEIMEFEFLLVDLMKRKLIDPIKAKRGDDKNSIVNIVIDSEK